MNIIKSICFGIAIFFQGYWILIERYYQRVYEQHQATRRQNYRKPKFWGE